MIPTLASRRGEHKAPVTNGSPLTIGKQGVVLVDIEPGTLGRVRVDGLDWQARAENAAAKRRALQGRGRGRCHSHRSSCDRQRGRRVSFKRKGGIPMLLIFAILLIIILVVLVRCIVIVPQSNAYVTEWLGVYKDTWGAGLHIRTPFVERISRKVSLKEEAADFPRSPSSPATTSP